MLWHSMPPELNTARLMVGAGAAPMLAAAMGWEAWAAALDAQAAEVCVRLNSLGEAWTGAGSDKAIAAATPMVSWLATASAQAKIRASKATAQAAAYTQAMAETPSLPEIAQNHVTTAALTATNFFGINTVPIAVNETDYFVRMWNQAAAAMDRYQAETIINTIFDKLEPMKPILASVGRFVTNGLDQAARIAPSVALPSKEAIGQTAAQVSGMTSSAQQLAQLVQQTTTLFSHTGGAGAAVSDAEEGTQVGLLGVSPLSNHPLAGGSGPSVGAGLIRADSMPGSAGLLARTSLMAQLVDKPTAAMAPAPASAAPSATAGTAPLGPMGHSAPAGSGSPRPRLATRTLVLPELDETDPHGWDAGEDW
ncbi:PPE family protein [Mycobacterium marinum]|uniref:PPE family protein n=1 Tax=Mycobacterium marinum TaxID=1781 RepID=UPI00192187B6|nr:PPE domain-containing protein [Mycobacterium marinum]MDC8996701.1 PPE family protein [Mycobacterium marinum]QQW33437.1 PPE family protein [Mycobacterium marinum]WDZ13971.1 PPE family protein [Mycobacterium marinum]